MNEYRNLSIDELRAKMTVRQLAFANHYYALQNVTQAAIGAGYSKKSAYSTGSENLKKPLIREYLSRLTEESSSALIATAEEVLQQLTRVLRREEKETVVVTLKSRKSYYDKQGKKVIEEDERAEIIEIPTRIADVNKAADLLGKHHSLYTMNANVNISDINVQVEYGEYTDTSE